MRVYELHTKFTSEAPAYDGIKVVEAWTRGFSNYTNGSGHFVTYGISLLENGDKIFSASEGLPNSVVGPDESRKSTFNDVTTLTGGMAVLFNSANPAKALGQREIRVAHRFKRQTAKVFEP